MYLLISSKWAHSHISGHVYKKVITRKLEHFFFFFPNENLPHPSNYNSPKVSPHCSLSQKEALQSDLEVNKQCTKHTYSLFS